jgi:hypothetical protein
MPAKAGIQNYLKTLDSRLRGNDVKRRFKTFYESIKVNIGLFLKDLKSKYYFRQVKPDAGRFLRLWAILTPECQIRDSGKNFSAVGWQSRIK